jgi:probable F420-dependent oxidoreductase
VVSSRRIEIGVEMMEPFEGRSWAQSAQALERLGYSTLFAPDHLDEGYGPITAMATAAAATTTLRVATAVFAADFRHPAFLARELASIDQLSQGRLEVGLGAGYQINDYRGSGIPMDPPKVRVDRLIEHVAVLRGLFGEGAFSYEGQHYKLTELNGTPSPYRPSGPPILVGGGGRRLLRFAARHADIVGVNPALPSSDARDQAALDSTAERMDEKFEWIRDSAGDRFDALIFHAWLKVAHVTDDAEKVVAPLARALGGSVEDVLASPVVLVGTVDEILARLRERRDRWGYTYYTIQQPVTAEFAAVVARLGEVGSSASL